ncbi:MAG: response regulator receiver protein [Acidobacteriales bacterium]|nr:response regulator receiver protein [Terriglobales bacterium]
MPMKILLADDSMTAQKMGKEILTAAGYEVTAVSNGAAAAKKLVDKFDVIILDINMPGYSGFEVCEKVRANMDIAKTPVLLTSGKMEHYEPADVQRVKADGVIIKPFEATDLIAVVKKLAAKAAAAAAPPPEKPEYEKTMVFTAPQIQEFKDQSYADWKTDSPSDEPAAETAPAAFEMSHAEASAPAFAMDMGTSSPTLSTDETAGFAPVPASAAMDFGSSAAAAPAFDMSGSSPAMDFGSSAAAAPAFGMEAAAPAFEMPTNAAASGFDLSPVESQRVESLLEPTAPSFEAAAVPMRDPSLDVMPAVHVAPVVDPYLEEAPVEEAVAYAIPAQDPALASRVDMASDEFVTKIGASEPVAEVEPVIEAAAPAVATDDDFEARVAAAMSGFEAPAEALEVPELIEPEPMLATEQNIIIEAIHTETRVEPPAYERTQKLEAVPEPEPEPVAVVEPVVESSQAAPEGMHDAELVEQMHAAFADLPVETEPHVVEEPVAVAEPEPIPLAVAEAPAASGPDLELASALAAAVGGESAAAAHATGLDHASLTSVVSRVMERMIPVVMMEIAKEIEAKKKG